MSNTTATFDAIGTHADATQGGKRAGFFARLIQARAKSGERAVRFQMSRMSDAMLADLGFTAEQIAYIRTNGKIPGSFWR